MKLSVVFLITLLFSSLTFANEQYSRQHCEQLIKEKEQVRKLMNSGYRERQRNSLNDKDRKLFNLISKHCRAPVTESDTDYSSQPSSSLRQQPINNSSSAINDNWSAHNLTYTGAKVVAWDNFYKIPKACRNHEISADDFIFCADDKKAQRAKFEKYWRDTQSKLAKTASPPKFTPVVISSASTHAKVEKSDNAIAEPDYKNEMLWLGLAFALLIVGGFAFIWKRK